MVTPVLALPPRRPFRTSPTCFGWRQCRPPLRRGCCFPPPFYVLSSFKSSLPSGPLSSSSFTILFFSLFLPSLTSFFLFARICIALRFSFILLGKHRISFLGPIFWIHQFSTSSLTLSSPCVTLITGSLTCPPQPFSFSQSFSLLHICSFTPVRWSSNVQI